MATEWFVKSGEKPVGPLTANQLKELAKAGTITTSSHICKGQDGEPSRQWVSASKVKGLFDPQTNQPLESVRANISSTEHSVTPPIADRTAQSSPYSAQEMHTDQKPASPKEASMREWYYADPLNQQNGPHSEATLKQLLTTGVIDLKTLLWCNGMDNWVPAKDVNEFSARANTMPPPLPVSTKPDPENIDHSISKTAEVRPLFKLTSGKLAVDTQKIKQNALKYKSYIAVAAVVIVISLLLIPFFFNAKKKRLNINTSGHTSPTTTSNTSNFAKSRAVKSWDDFVSKTKNRMRDYLQTMKSAKVARVDTEELTKSDSLSYSYKGKMQFTLGYNYGYSYYQTINYRIIFGFKDGKWEYVDGESRTSDHNDKKQVTGWGKRNIGGFIGERAKIFPEYDVE